MANPLITKTDRVLVSRFLRTRDETSFRELYRCHAPALYAFAFRFCGSEADAQEAVQETWIRASKILERFEWRSSLRSWLTGILINCVRESSRGHQRCNDNELPTQSLSSNMEDPARTIALEQAINQLATGYRHVLVLHDIEGHTHEEISAFLSISVGTSKSQLHHARKALRSKIGTM
jgi:RNA polymerase sigma-70 factor (ECF subfamily)